MTVTAPAKVSRFASHRWRRHLPAWRPGLLTGIVVAGLVFGGWIVFFSSWLGLSHVEVHGTQRVTAADVEAAANLAAGTPLARVDIGAVEARIEQIPAVAAVAVHRGWPHTLVVDVTERQPVAVVHQQGAWWLVDRSGARFGQSERPDPGQPIVEIDGAPGGDTLRQVAQVVGSLPPVLAPLTRRVSAASVDSITLHLSDGSEVHWGNATQSAIKARVLTALLPKHARIYDVSAPAQPATSGRLQASG